MTLETATNPVAEVCRKVLKDAYAAERIILVEDILESDESSQVRHDDDPEHINHLADDLKKKALSRGSQLKALDEIIIVEEVGRGKVKLCDGDHRTDAHRLLGWKKIRAGVLPQGYFVREGISPKIFQVSQNNRALKKGMTLYEIEENLTEAWDKPPISANKDLAFTWLREGGFGYSHNDYRKVVNRIVKDKKEEAEEKDDSRSLVRNYHTRTSKPGEPYDPRHAQSWFATNCEYVTKGKVRSTLFNASVPANAERQLGALMRQMSDNQEKLTSSPPNRLVNKWFVYVKPKTASKGKPQNIRDLRASAIKRITDIITGLNLPIDEVWALPQLKSDEDMEKPIKFWTKKGGLQNV
jgi:hypothetical protein